VIGRLLGIAEERKRLLLSVHACDLKSTVFDLVVKTPIFKKVQKNGCIEKK
jgi:hypothetical protein